MDVIKIAAIVLMTGGVLGLVYGGFTYTRDTQQAKLGPLEVTVSDRKTIDVPIWASAGAVALGGVLLVVGGRRR